MTIKVDLLPTERRGFQIDPLVIVLFVFVVATSGAFYYYGQTLEQQIQKIQADQKIVEDEIKQCETAKQAITKEKDKLAKLERQFQLVKSLMHDPLKYANLLTEVGSLLPDTVFIDNLSIEPNGTISLSGTAAGQLPLSIIAATMKNFNESVYFDGTTLQNASRKELQDVFTFSMAIHYDALAATEKSPGTKDGVAGAPPPPPPDQTQPEPSAPETSTPTPTP